ncbi:hypothetical protein WDU94_013930 [Cyamophila willieti]
MDCFLRWDRHIEALTKRLRRYIYPFLILRTFLPLYLLKEVYHALVQSALEYGIAAYGRADKSHNRKLESIQNTLLKIIYKKNRLYPTKDLYKNLGILNRKNLYIKNVCTLIHQNQDKFVKQKFSKYQLRRINLRIEKCLTNKGQKSIKYNGIKLYSEIPTKIKQVKDIKIFKKEIKGG